MEKAIFNFKNDFVENQKAVILADISMSFYLPKLTKNIFEGLVGKNKNELLSSLKICEKAMKKTFSDLKEKEAFLEKKYFSDMATGKLFLTIKTYIENQNFNDICFDDFLEKIENKCFHYTSTRKPVEDYFNGLKEAVENDEAEATEADDEAEAKKEITHFEKAKKLVNNIKNLDLTFDEIQVLCDMLKQC